MKLKFALMAAVPALFLCTSPESQAVMLSPGDILVTDTDLFGSGGPGGIIRVDPLTGDRTIVSGFGIGSGPDIYFPVGTAIDASGSILVVDAAENNIFRVDPITGDRTVVSSESVGVGAEWGGPIDIAIEQDGNLVVSTNASHGLPSAGYAVGNVMRFNSATGDRSIVSSSVVNIGTGPNLNFPLGIAIDANGTIFVLEPTEGGSILQIDPLTGNRSTISGNGVGAGPSFNFSPDQLLQEITIDENGDILVVDAIGGAIFRVDPDSGDRAIVSGPGIGSGPSLSSPVAGSAPNGVPSGIAIGVGGTILVTQPFFTGTDFGTLFAIDPLTGDRTVLSGTGVGLGPEFMTPTFLTVVPVPEPASVVILLSGLFCMMAWKYTNRK